MNNDLMFSSRYRAWDTPQDFFDKQNAIHGFSVDVCASDANFKCDTYFTEKMDGLNQEWFGTCWCNPPYGSEIPKWVAKASRESFYGTKTVMLIPARTDTRWFHQFIYRQQKVEVEFLKGRLTFGSDEYWEWLWEQETIDGKENKLYGKIGKKNPAPFPSMLVVFNP